MTQTPTPLPVITDTLTPEMAARVFMAIEEAARVAVQAEVANGLSLHRVRNIAREIANDTARRSLRAFLTR